MAYNNGFPMSYQPYNYYPASPTPANVGQTQNDNSGILWVQGEAGAKSWAVAPSKSVLLMDSETNRFYIKSSDASGMPMPLRVFSYSEETTSSTPLNTSDYVTKSELEEKIKEIISSMKKEDE